MANAEHVEILKRGVDAWNKWRKEDPKTRPVLSEASLSGVDLRRANFAGVALFGANLFEVNLAAANLDGADLRKSDLCGADLTGTSLTVANLDGANLSRATLVGAILTGANLFGGNFTRANLRRTHFERAYVEQATLEEADLTEANFIAANLSRASLRGADLAHVLLGGTNLGAVDLSATKNLESCQHSAPSMIDQQTLVKSGPLPEVFLRGCGLSDEFINYIPLLFWSKKAIEFYSCFISYSHEDKSFARRLHDTLQGRGIRCWLDEKQMLPGDDIYEQVDRGIRLWDKVLLCCSKYSLSSWWVDSEINKAFEKERQLFKDRGKTVLALIPLNLDGYLFGNEWQSGKRDEIHSVIILPKSSCHHSAICSALTSPTIPVRR